MSKKYVLDLLERVVRTFLAVFLPPVIVVLNGGHLAGIGSVAGAAGVAGLGAVATLVLGVVTKPAGSDKDSASVL